LVQDFAWKLRVTAAALGASTRKDLARAFRRANPATTFEVDRAAKWLQGRARPREQSLYEDWAAVLDLGRPAAWLGECGPEEFLEAVCARHGVAAEALRRRAEAFVRPRPAAAAAADRRHHLCGTFACYRHAFSPYYRGRLIRASMVIEQAAGAGAPSLRARYAESLPTGVVRPEGPVGYAGRSLYVDLSVAAGDGDLARAFFSLFMPAPPASVLAGLHCGATLIGALPEPSCSRLAIVRVPHEDAASVERSNRYMEPGESVARDLAALGLAAGRPGELDARLDRLLRGGPGGGLDQLDAAEYTALVATLDRAWLDTLARRRGPSAPEPVAPAIAEA
jgi:hypothetical protein